MAVDPRKRQKKLADRAVRRKEKQQQQVRMKNAGLPDRLQDAARHPILACWITDSYWTHGIGHLCISRQLPGGMVAYAVFLVDRFCLGVKNGFGDVAPLSTYEQKIEEKVRSNWSVEEMAPAAARKLIESAVAYARDLGLAPHTSYRQLMPIFGTYNAADCLEEFEFGVRGKPCFVAGPLDTPQRCDMIIRILERRCGKSGFQFVIRHESDAALA